MTPELAYEITLDCDTKTAWKILTDNQYIPKYMFGSKAKSDWKKGSKLDFFVEKDGEEQKVVTGQVLEYDPPAFLKHTLFPVGAEYSNSLENHLIIRYSIEASGDKTILRIRQKGFDTVADGKQRFIHAQKAWEAVIPLMKATAID